MLPDLVQDMVKAIEVKDLSTAAHTWRVVLYLRAMLEEHGVDPHTLEIATQGAALHDVGKLDVPDHILQKAGRLTDEEFAVVRTHTVTGYDRLVNAGVTDQLILDVVRFHHERWDGLGYPDRLKGEQIPLIARCFAVIDTFDALTSLRPYRRDVGPEAARRALDIIHADTGTHYWPEAADMFSRLYASGRLDYILEYFNDTASVPTLGDRTAGGRITRRPTPE